MISQEKSSWCFFFLIERKVLWNKKIQTCCEKNKLIVKSQNLTYVKCMNILNSGSETTMGYEYFHEWLSTDLITLLNRMNTYGVMWFWLASVVIIIIWVIFSRGISISSVCDYTKKILYFHLDLLQMYSSVLWLFSHLLNCHYCPEFWPLWEYRNNGDTHVTVSNSDWVIETAYWNMARKRQPRICGNDAKMFYFIISFFQCSHFYPIR